MDEVLETTGRVTETSRHVRIDEGFLSRFVEDMLYRDIQSPAWDAAHHFSGEPEQTALYILVLDTLNFCFWPPPGEETWEIRHQSEAYAGYFGLSVALKRAAASRTPILDPQFLARITPDDLKRILAGRGCLQLMAERCQNLRELGRVLLDDYNGKASSLIEDARQSAVGLARCLVDKLPSFRDRAEYDGKRVFFYKRAQITAADLHGSFQGKGPGRFTDMDRLTAFADYKLPQVLRHLGILRYASDLARKVDNRALLAPGSPEEVEIRACTVRAVERIRQALEERGRRLRAFEIDGILWQMGQRTPYRKKPYHLTRSIFY